MSLQKQSWRSARNICIVKTLAKLGHYPTRKSEKEAWFLSPLRSETQASFSVSLNKNLWYDFGEGIGGNVIDLVMLLLKCSFQESLLFLAENSIPFSFCPPLTVESKNQNNSLQIIRCTTLHHPGLLQYTIQRGIPVSIARTYCKEVWYRIKNQEYFAIGLKNHLGGWELRNKYCKNSTSPKSYSIIDHSSKRLLITEGIFDFLSLVVLEKELVNSSNCIVLNSLAFLKDVRNIIPNYNEVLLFLDNDTSGEKATTELLNLYKNITDCSESYTGFIDLNAKLKD